MDVTTFNQWLSAVRLALIAAIAEGVRDHVAALAARGVEFYGYALLPGEPLDIRNLVAVTNSEVDIEVADTHDQYGYYRYSVDEWANWEHSAFASANALIAEANEQLAAACAEEDDDSADEFGSAYSDAVFDAVICGLDVAKSAGSFAGREPFLAVWISDSGHPIMADSVRRLNSPEVADAFMAEFG